MQNNGLIYLPVVVMIRETECQMGGGGEGSQQTLHIHQMLEHCCFSVADGGPTMYQHWVNVSCLLGACTHNKHTQCPILLYHCWASVDDSVLALTHNHREAANIRRPRNAVNR